jgi:hypothetical protein
MSGGAQESHRRTVNHRPAIPSDADGMPFRIAEIDEEMLAEARDTYMDLAHD